MSPNAIQVNMAGTGIGTFNDRLRDALQFLSGQRFKEATQAVALEVHCQTGTVVAS